MKEIETEKNFNRPYVTPVFYGQLGNQLFIISATMSYAWDYNVIPIFPSLNTEKNRTSHNKKRLFFRLDDSPIPRPYRHVFREQVWYSAQRIPFQNDLVLDGYFQSWKHFHHHRNELLSLFAPTELIINNLNKYRDLIENSKTVALHIRTAGKILHEKRLQPFFGLEYYRKTMDLFPPDSLFVIFSDRINWCKKHLPALNRKFVFIEGNDGMDDLFLMSMMRHVIIANSTFSWWAAYLNQHPSKRIIAPEYWGGEPHPPHPPTDLFLPDWEIQSVPPFEAYPKDMYDYGETQSIDGNW
jgi:hypothetical protein